MARRGRGHGDKLAGREEQVIVALLSASSIEAAARNLGVDPSTLRRWLKLPSFRKRYLVARMELYDQAVGQLYGATGDAVAVLRKQLKARKAADRTRAALAILDRTFKAYEDHDLKEALEMFMEVLDKREAG